MTTYFTAKATKSSLQAELRPHFAKLDADALDAIARIVGDADPEVSYTIQRLADMARSSRANAAAGVLQTRFPVDPRRRL